jgi:Domain of unknown function (DUF1981)
VALLNIHRLIYRSPDVAWDTTTSHLLMIIRLSFAPQAIRVQAARVLDEILLIVPRNPSKLQARVLDALAQQVVPDPSIPSYQQTSTSVELRRMGLETLHQILQASGHTFVVGWEIIFQMLESVCRQSSTLACSAVKGCIGRLSNSFDESFSRHQNETNTAGFRQSHGKEL